MYEAEKDVRAEALEKTLGSSKNSLPGSCMEVKLAWQMQQVMHTRHMYYAPVYKHDNYIPTIGTAIQYVAHLKANII